jgi:hypothetical protein
MIVLTTVEVVPGCRTIVVLGIHCELGRLSATLAIATEELIS